MDPDARIVVKTKQVRMKFNMEAKTKKPLDKASVVELTHRRYGLH